MKIIFDVDGTLMDVEHRRKFVDGSQQVDWPAFEAATVDDTRHEHIFEIAECMKDAGHSIVVVSARKERQRAITEKQLSEVGIIYDTLIMGIKGGKRVLINDRKPNGSKNYASAINLTRNEGINNIKIK